MSHKVEISDKTYDDLKEFCSLNGLKIGQLADKYIRDGLMMEMYGDVPFTNYRKPSPEVKGQMIETEETLIEDAVNENLNEIIGFKWEGAGGPDVLLTRGDLAHRRELVVVGLDDNEFESVKKAEETLKNNGVPSKVIKKITKRRLK